MKRSSNGFDEEARVFAGLGTAPIPLLSDKSVVIPPGSIRIPAKYGRVTEVHAAADSRLTVLHIQHADWNRDGEVATAFLVERLISSHGVQLVVTEGSWKDDVRLVHTRHCHSSRKRRAIARRAFFEEAQYSGEEYLYVVSDHPLDSRGAENRDLVDAQWRAYGMLAPLVPAASGFLARFAECIEAWQSEVFSPRLRAVDAAIKAYENESVTTADHARFLFETAERAGLEVRVTSPNLMRALKIRELEGKIDFGAVDSERSRAVSWLQGRFEGSSLPDFEMALPGWWAGESEKADPYARLVSLLTDPDRYPNLRRYTDYLRTFQSLDPVRLYAEMDSLGVAIRESLHENQEQKAADRIGRHCRLLRKFVKQELVPEEYAAYQTLAQTGEMRVERWLEVLSRKSGRPLPEEPPESLLAILPLLESFYQISFQRAHVFVDRTLEHIEHSRGNAAVLIAGGFHTPTVTRLLREKGVSYAVIAPNIHTPTDCGLREKVWRRAVKRVLAEGG